jgi:CubicO group peptidase (beta-lactamase class C family)
MSSPSPTGLSDAGLSALHGRIEADLHDGHLSAAQVAIAHQGRIVHRAAFGAADDDSRFVIFSATKTIVAMALLPHLADGSLELTAPVARYIPEWGTHGKHETTVLQLLTMQGGFPYALMHPKKWGSSASRREAFAEWTLDYAPGTRTEYHPISAHWVIAELLEALTGRPYVEVVHERVVAPAGVGPILGPDAIAEREPMLIRAVGTYPTDRQRLVDTYGRDDLIPQPSYTYETMLSMNDRRTWMAAIPGGGAIASASTMALVYQTFLHNPGGQPADWLADAIGTVRNGSITVSDGVPANRTVAGYVSGHDGYHDHRWMPPTPRAFGHPGAGGQLHWVDPDTGISISFLHDTLNNDPTVEFRRNADVNRLALMAWQG